MFTSPALSGRGAEGTFLDNAEITMTIVTYGDYTLDTSAIPAPMVERLLVRGFSSIMQDVVAGYAKELKAEGKSEDEIAAELHAVRTDTLKALQDGTYSTRTRGGGAPKESPFDREFYAVAKAGLAALLAKQGKELPKSDPKDTEGGKSAKEKIKDLIARFEAKNEKTAAQAAAWRKEAERRVKNAGKVSEDDLSLDDLI
jgi:cytochrome c556